MRNRLKYLKIGFMCIVISGFVVSSARGQTVPSRDVNALDAKVSKLLKTCFSCHGPGGISQVSSRPSIAGQKASYVARQLFAFQRTAKAMKAKMEVERVKTMDMSPGVMAQHLVGRRNPMMNHILDGLDAPLILRLSQAVSRLACRKENPVSKPTFSASAPPTMIDRCAVCHGVDGISVQPDTPNLAGQKRSYLRRELLLIRESAWGAAVRKGEAGRSHPIMESRVARLKITDVDALALYYSRLDCRGAGQK